MREIIYTLAHLHTHLQPHGACVRVCEEYMHEEYEEYQVRATPPGTHLRVARSIECVGAAEVEIEQPQQGEGG